MVQLNACQQRARTVIRSKGRLTVLRLARRAMAQLTVQWLLSAQLVLHLPAMAARLIPCLEVLVGLMHAVRWTELPLVLRRDGLLALCLCVVHIVLGDAGGKSRAADEGRSEEKCTLLDRAPSCSAEEL